MDFFILALEARWNIAFEDLNYEKQMKYLAFEIISFENKK